MKQDRHKMVEHVCLTCGSVFLGRPLRKYCSNHCFGFTQSERLITLSKSRAKGPERGADRQRKFYRLNREHCLEKDKKLRESVVEFLGGSCIACGYHADVRALQLDHKFSDGAEDRKKHGAKVARYYSSHPIEAMKNLQVLCANCNKIKAIECNEYNRTRRIS